jgi:hypothetical protein
MRRQFIEPSLPFAARSPTFQSWKILNHEIHGKDFDWVERVQGDWPLKGSKSTKTKLLFLDGITE